MIGAYTTVSPDGVIGLNGRFYLEDADGERMLFKNIEDAKACIADRGEDPEDDYIDYVEIDEDGEEYDLDHDGKRTAIGSTGFFWTERNYND